MNTIKILDDNKPWRKTLSANDISYVKSKKWFKVVRRDNSPFYDSLIRVGGCAQYPFFPFENTMKDMICASKDIYACTDDFDSLKSEFVRLGKKDSAFFIALFDQLDIECAHFEKNIQTIKKQNAENMNRQNFLSHYNNFVEGSLSILTFLWPPLAAEDFLIEEVQRIIAKRVDPLKNTATFTHAIEVLTLPSPSLLAQKDEATLRLAATQDKDSKHKQKIISVHQRFAWLKDSSLRFDYESYDDFLSHLEEISPTAAEKVRLLEKQRKQHDLEKKNMLKDFSLNENEMNYIVGASRVANARLLRTEKIIEGAYMLQDFFSALAKHLGIKDITNYYYWEIEAMLKGEKIVANVDARSRGFELFILKDAIIDPDKKSADALMKSISEKDATGTFVKGKTACRGCVKGVARILDSPADIRNMKSGDILITSMTTPAFVPAMKIAGAIVTDEGGISCHAAIVSRELNKPCVIATKNATKIFSDGDLLEVDATNGVVRKL